MMRRECVRAVGGYDESRPSLFDYDLWIRLAERGFALARIDATVAYHRIHPGQSFERQRRLEYIIAAFRIRRRAAQLFGEGWRDSVMPFVGLAFGMIPVGARTRLFRLAGE